MYTLVLDGNAFDPLYESIEGGLLNSLGHQLAQRLKGNRAYADYVREYAELETLTRARSLTPAEYSRFTCLRNEINAMEQQMAYRIGMHDMLSIVKYAFQDVLVQGGAEAHTGYSIVPRADDEPLER